MNLLRRRSNNQCGTVRIPQPEDPIFKVPHSAATSFRNTIRRTDSSSDFKNDEIMTSPLTVHGCICKSSYLDTEKDGQYFKEMKLIRFTECFMWFSKGAQVLNFGDTKKNVACTL
jgi:hypothetical protein